MTQYVMRIYEKYYKDRMKENERDTSEKKNSTTRLRFPAILPMIYYDGEGSWTAPDNMRELIQPVEWIDQYCLKMKSMVVTLNKISEEKLMELKNALSIYLLLNHAQIVKKYREKIFQMVIEIMQTLDEKEKTMIQIYIRSIAQSLLQNITEEETEELKNCKGVENSMEVLDRIYQENYYKGKEDGLQQGLQQGLHEGKLESAIRLLKRGTPIDQVADILGLVEDEILKYQSEKETRNPHS